MQSNPLEELVELIRRLQAEALAELDADDEAWRTACERRHENVAKLNRRAIELSPNKCKEMVRWFVTAISHWRTSGPVASSADRLTDGERLDALLLKVPALVELIQSCKPKPKRKRRRQSEKRTDAALTAKQTEAVYLVGEHKGNVAAAAASAGKSRAAMTKLYQKAMDKLGKRRVQLMQTEPMKTDHRGQIDVSDEDDRR